MHGLVCVETLLMTSSSYFSKEENEKVKFSVSFGDHCEIIPCHNSLFGIGVWQWVILQIVYIHIFSHLTVSLFLAIIKQSN